MRKRVRWGVALALAFAFALVALFFWRKAAPPKATSDVRRQPQVESSASERAKNSAPPPVVLSSSPSSPDALTTDEDFLREASRQNSVDKEAALRLVLEAEGRFKASPLFEPRRALRITLLVDLGRMEEARALVREFIKEYPSSEYRPLVQGVTGIHPRPLGPRTLPSPSGQVPATQPH